MTEGFFAIIIAIVAYLIYDNVAKKKSPDSPLNQVKPTRPKAEAAPKPKAVKAATPKPKRTAASPAETKPSRRKKTDA
jgi:hypothetical protein